jgi:hypothetical protein
VSFIAVNVLNDLIHFSKVLQTWPIFLVSGHFVVINISLKIIGMCRNMIKILLQLLLYWAEFMIKTIYLSCLYSYRHLDVSV